MTLSELRARLKGAVMNGENEGTSFCPSHDDKEKRSLSFAQKGDRLLLKCFVGCSAEEITAALGCSLRDLFINGQGNSHAPAPSRPLTLEDFAAAKHLPVAFLAEHGVQQESWGLRISYLERDGRPAAQQRRRTHLVAKSGSLWVKGAGSPIPYGRWRLDDAMEKGDLNVFEGESNPLTAWFHNLPALGIPGADMVQVLTAEDLRGIDRLWIYRDPDRGGDTFVAQLAARLREVGWPGRASVVRLPVKDISDLHVSAGEGFATELERAKAAAVPIESSLVSSASISPTEAWPLYDGAEDWDFDPVQFIVEQLLPMVGVVWWGGLPKRFKTLCLMALCLAIACRRETFAKHFRIFKYPRILFLAREDGGGRIKQRRDDILAAWGCRPEPGAIRFLIRPHFDLLDPGHIAWLRDLCVREDITLLVLDTWTALSPTADPLGTKEQAVLAAVVVRLAEDIRGTVVVVDHSRKNRPEGQALSSADIFGPPQKWAAAEAIVMLGSTDDARRIEVFIESKDGDGGRFFLAISPRGSGEEKFTYAGSIEQLAEDQRAVGDANRQAVLETLLANTEAMSVAELVSTLEAGGRKLSRDTVQRHLTALQTGGRVRRTGAGKATRYFALSFTPREPFAAHAGAANG